MNRLTDRIIRQKQNIFLVVMGLFGGISLCKLFDIMVEETTFNFSIFSLPVYVVVFILMKKFLTWFQEDAGDKKRYKRVIYAMLLGSLLGLSQLMGWWLQIRGYTPNGVKGKLELLWIAMGIGTAILPILYAYFRWLDHRKQSTTDGISKSVLTRVFFISWAVIFAAWIPAFLAYYPAVMSYDCNQQFQMAYLGYDYFNAHHPLVHTFLIRVFLLLGEKIGSYQIAMAAYAIVQMLVLSVIFAYACNMMVRMSKKKWPGILAVMFFAFLPFHGVLALCVTKDVLFSAFFLLLCLLIVEYNRADDKKMKRFLIVAIPVVGIWVMLFRNNAIYGFAAFAIFYIVLSKKDRLMIAILCAVILVGGKFGAQGLQTAMKAESGSEVEKYSVFLTQFARIGLVQGDNLDYEEYELVSKYVDSIHWRFYNPHIADGVKNNVKAWNFDRWKDDIPAMLKDWITIGIRYPNDFIDAFLELTRGYWFLDDVSHAEVLGYGENTEWGLIYTANLSESALFEGVQNNPVLPGLTKVYQKILNGNSYYNWPIVSLLFKPAFYGWILVVVLVSLSYMKQWRKCILALLPFWYLCTLLLGPVVNFRYIYPIIVVMPILLVWTLSNCDWKIKNDKKIAIK